VSDHSINAAATGGVATVGDPTEATFRPVRRFVEDARAFVADGRGEN
jgi:hypothetical protein